MTLLETHVVRWWESHRPAGWSLTMHCASPTVNVAGDAARELAEQAA